MPNVRPRGRGNLTFKKLLFEIKSCPTGLEGCQKSGVRNMSFEIHREPLYRRYYATYTSPSFLYGLIFGFLLIILPLIIAYNSTGFWYKEGIYFEQPHVNYRYQAIVEVYGTAGFDRSSSSQAREDIQQKPLLLYYSSSSKLNQMHGNQFRPATIQSAEMDDDRDGINERLEFNMVMPLAPNEQVTGVSAVLLNDVTISERARYQFDAATLISFDGGSAINNLRVDGDVMVRQSWPLSTKGGFKVPYSGDPLLTREISPGMSASDLSIQHIMAETATRNLSTVFRPTYTIATRPHEPAMVDLDPRYFNMTVSMRVPEQPLWYTPNASEVLKWAWMQYISFFVLIGWLLFRLNSYVFRHQLLPSYPVADIVNEKMD